MLHLLIRVFHDYWTSEFLCALLFLILWTKIDTISVFGLCQYGSIPIPAFLHFSPSVFCSPQNCHFVVHFISLHISLIFYDKLYILQCIVPLSSPCRLQYYKENNSSQIFLFTECFAERWTCGSSCLVYGTELSVDVMNLDGCNLFYVGICGHVWGSYLTYRVKCRQVCRQFI